MDYFKSVQEFVTFSAGTHAIRKILIANNGIGATKAIRSIRRWYEVFTLFPICVMILLRSFETFGNERMVFRIWLLIKITL